MVSSYIINKECTLNEFLESNHLSKSNINKLIECKAISNSNEYLNKDSIINIGDEIYINYSLLEENEYELFDKEITVLYEDREIIAVEKPRGILIHSDGNTNETLLNAVCNYLNKQGDDSFVRCLHRIDVDTTGIVLFSKNILAYNNINYQIENLLVNKEYRALVEGEIFEDGDVNLPIGRDRHNSRKYIVCSCGKPAYTKYQVIERKKGKTLLKVNITTGRTHQIRVHLSHIGHPIIGDSIYGKKGKLKLHFYKIGFSLYGRYIEIKSKNQIGDWYG